MQIVAAAAVVVLVLFVLGELRAQGEQTIPPEELFPPGGPTWPSFPDAGMTDPTEPVALPRAGPRDTGQWDNQIVYMCSLYGMNDALAPLMVKAIIEHESAHTWDPTIPGDRGPCGPYRGDARYNGYCSIGLMQVHRPSHPDLATAYDLRDGNQNILAGGQVLAGAWRSWPDWESVLETYNQGRPAAGVTTNYARLVGATFQRLASEAGILV